MRARGLLGISCALAVSSTAWAEPAVPVVTLPTILVGVGADRQGWQRAMDEKLDDGIRASGRAPRMPGPLDGGEMSCREPECMARVAEGAGGGIVLGAKIVGDRGSPPSFKIILTRFDHDRPGTVKQETAECSVCTQADAADRLTQMVAAMLPSLTFTQPRHPPVVEQPVVTPPLVVERPRRTVSKKLLYAAIGTSAAFGAAGLAMLGVGGRAFALDGTAVGSVPAGSQPKELYDTRATGIGLTVAGSMLVVSAAIELGFEVWLLKKRSR